MVFHGVHLIEINTFFLPLKQTKFTMGHAYPYQCTRCGYQQDFYHGHGFLIHSQPLNEYLEQNQQLFHYKTQGVLIRLAAQNANLFLKSGFENYKCTKCKTLQQRKAVVVYDEETVIYRSEYRCSSCRVRLKLTNIHRIKLAVCPKCGKRTFRMNHNNLILWD